MQLRQENILQKIQAFNKLNISNLQLNLYKQTDFIQYAKKNPVNTCVLAGFFNSAMGKTQKV